MKKLVLAIAAIGFITMTSCKKEYTCACTVTVAGTSTTTEAKSGTKLSKADAKTWCEKGTTSSGTGYSVSCKIK